MTLETEEYKGYTIEIEPDMDAESPREWSCVATLYFWSRKNLSPDTIPEELSGRSMPDLKEIRRVAEMHGEVILIVPVSVYDHSGIIYSVGSDTQFPDYQWDAGQAGWAVVYRKDYEECCEAWEERPDQYERALQCVKDEVETYTQWCNGEVYAYVIKYPDGDIVDSLWEIWGKEEAMQMAKDYIDGMEGEANAG